MIWGLDLQVASHLPIPPPVTPEEVGRRIARHVFAEELIGLGQEVGPKWNEEVHSFRLGATLFVSPEMYAKIKDL